MGDFFPSLISWHHLTGMKSWDCTGLLEETTDAAYRHYVKSKFPLGIIRKETKNGRCFHSLCSCKTLFSFAFNVAKMKTRDNSREWSWDRVTT